MRTRRPQTQVGRQLSSAIPSLVTPGCAPPWLSRSATVLVQRVPFTHLAQGTTASYNQREATIPGRDRNEYQDRSCKSQLMEKKL